jgi:hypothetical protein
VHVHVHVHEHAHVHIHGHMHVPAAPRLSQTRASSQYQIAVLVPSVYEVELPPAVRRLNDMFSVGISLGLQHVGPALECMGFRGFLSTLIFYMAAPIALALVILLYAMLTWKARPQSSSEGQSSATTDRGSKASRRVLEKAAPLLLQLAFLAYPMVANKAFEAFSCHKFVDSEWLKADVSIRCHTADHRKVLLVAWVAIALYPVG